MNRRRFLQSTATLAAAAASGCASNSSDSGMVVSRELAFAFDDKGNRYEIDIRGYTVRRVDERGATAWTVGSAADSKFRNGPTSLVVDDAGNVYIADRGNGEIEKVSPSGVPVGTFGKELHFAHDIAFAPGASLIFASDGPRNRIHAYDLQGGAVRVFGTFGQQGAGLNFPHGLAVSDAQELHVVDSGNARIQVFGLDGGFRRSYGGASDSAGRLRGPRDIAFTPAGEAVVADPTGRRLAWFDARGAFVGDAQVHLADNSIGNPAYVAVGPGGRLYVTVI